MGDVHDHGNNRRPVPVHPAKPRIDQPADRAFLEEFDEARFARWALHHGVDRFSGITAASLRQQEREAWDRLIRYLLTLPPPPNR